VPSKKQTPPDLPVLDLSVLRAVATNVPLDNWHANRSGTVLTTNNDMVVAQVEAGPNVAHYIQMFDPATIRDLLTLAERGQEAAECRESE
jgi:hypothetical protein